MTSFLVLAPSSSLIEAPSPPLSLKFLETGASLWPVNRSEQLSCMVVEREKEGGKSSRQCWSVHGKMDELSHFIGAMEPTVNIRGNDIDFKVLRLQMSLVRSLFFLNSPDDLIYIFPPSPPPVPRMGEKETRQL